MSSDGVELSSIWEAGSWFPVRAFGILLLVMLFLMIVFGVFRKDFSHLKPLLTLFVLLIALGGRYSLRPYSFLPKTKMKLNGETGQKTTVKLLLKKMGQQPLVSVYP